MSKLVKLLFLSSVFLALLTLAKDIGAVRIYLFDLAFLPCLFFLFLQRMTAPATTRFRWQTTDGLVLALIVSVSVAFIASENRAQSAVTYVDWLRVTAFYFAARMVFDRVVAQKSWQRMLWFALAVMLVIGLIQAITGTSFGLIGNYFGRGTDQAISATVDFVGSRRRVSGTTTNPIIFAMWVTMFALFVAADLITRKRFIGFVVVSSLAALVVLSTLSRGAIGAFAMSWLILIFINRKEMVRVVFAGMVFLALAMPLAYFGFLQDSVGEAAALLKARIERQELLGEESGRVTVFKMGMELIEEPKIFLTGTGPDNMVMAYNKYVKGVRSNTSNVGFQRSGVHNVWMKMLVEYGVVSALLLIAIWVGAVRRSLTLLKRKRTDPTARTWGGFWLAFLIPYLLLDCSVYESAMAYHIFIPLFTMLAFLVHLTGGSVAQTTTAPVAGRRGGRAQAAAVATA